MSQYPSFPTPLSSKIHDDLWQWAQNHYGLHGQWHTLWLNDVALGKVNDDWQAQIQKDWPGKWQRLSDGLHLYADTWLNLGDGLQHMAYDWKQIGLLHGWRDERFDVNHLDGRTLFSLERAAFRPLGLMSHAVHLNGLTFQDGEWRFWIGRRSAHKAVDPNKLDNLVGGGIASGEDMTAAMLRESEEEAGLLPEHLTQLSLKNQIHSLRNVSRGLHNEVLYIFDVILDAGIRPENQDGEVAGFELMSVTQILDAMFSHTMMSDSQLVTVDAFARYGLIDPHHPLYRWLQQIRVG